MEARELARLGVTAREFKATDTPFGMAQTPEQRRLLQETYGRLASQYVRDAIRRPEYQRATDEQQAATLERGLRTAGVFADPPAFHPAAPGRQAHPQLEWAQPPH